MFNVCCSGPRLCAIARSYCLHALRVSAHKIIRGVKLNMDPNHWHVVYAYLRHAQPEDVVVILRSDAFFTLYMYAMSSNAGKNVKHMMAAAEYINNHRAPGLIGEAFLYLHAKCSSPTRMLSRPAADYMATTHTYSSVQAYMRQHGSADADFFCSTFDDNTCTAYDQHIYMVKLLVSMFKKDHDTRWLCVYRTIDKQCYWTLNALFRDAKTADDMRDVRCAMTVLKQELWLDPHCLNVQHQNPNIHIMFSQTIGADPVNMGMYIQQFPAIPDMLVYVYLVYNNLFQQDIEVGNLVAFNCGIVTLLFSPLSHAMYNYTRLRDNYNYFE